MFDALPPAVQAYIRYLEARLADLEARLGQTSANSSKPPSSDPPHAKPAPPKTPSGKRKGGQPGHPKRTRPDLPPDTIVELRPARVTGARTLWPATTPRRSAIRSSSSRPSARS